MREHLRGAGRAWSRTHCIRRLGRFGALSAFFSLSVSAWSMRVWEPLACGRLELSMGWATNCAAGTVAQCFGRAGLASCRLALASRARALCGSGVTRLIDTCAAAVANQAATRLAFRAARSLSSWRALVYVPVARRTRMRRPPVARSVRCLVGQAVVAPVDAVLAFFSGIMFRRLACGLYASA